MKLLVIGLLAIVTAFTDTIIANASAANVYTCECQDTGIECDGGERLDVTLKNNLGTIKYGEKDFRFVDTFNIKLDSNYMPRSRVNNGFKKFNILSTTSDGFQIKKSSFLIDQNLINGKANGIVKFQSVNAESIGGGFWSWAFKCTKRFN